MNYLSTYNISPSINRGNYDHARRRKSQELAHYALLHLPPRLLVAPGRDRVDLVDEDDPAVIIGHVLLGVLEGAAEVVSDSPVRFDMITSGPLITKKYVPVSAATACVMAFLPHPLGLVRSTPWGVLIPRFVHSSR